VKVSRRKKDEEKEKPVQKDVLDALRETRMIVENLKSYLTEARHEFRYLFQTTRPKPLRQLVNEIRPIRLIRKRVFRQSDGGNNRAG
jgi:hypothetical protein